MKKFLRNCWVYHNARFTVEWDDTDLPYTEAGPRKTGTFEMTGFLRVWLWGQVFCFFSPRASVVFEVVAQDPLGNSMHPT